MKNVASLFKKEALDALEEVLDIRLIDEHDYSQEELDDIYAQIELDFGDKADDLGKDLYDYDGNPTKLGEIFEYWIDAFPAHGFVTYPSEN